MLFPAPATAAAATAAAATAAAVSGGCAPSVSSAIASESEIAPRSRAQPARCRAERGQAG